MTVETATYISDFNTAKPDETDPKSEGDNHLRLIKSVLQSTLPNVAGAVTPTHTQRNTVPNLAPAASPTLTGTPAATSGQCSGRTCAGAATLKLPAAPALGRRLGSVAADGGTDNVVQRN